MSDLRDIAVKYAHLLSAPDYSQLLNEADRIAELEAEIYKEQQETTTVKAMEACLEEAEKESHRRFERIAELEAANETLVGGSKVLGQWVEDKDKRIAELEGGKTMLALTMRLDRRDKKIVKLERQVKRLDGLVKRWEMEFNE